MSDFQERMASAKAAAVALGIDEPDDGEGRLLAEEYGMTGMPPKEPERDLDIIEGEILFYKRQAGRAFLEIGKRLNEAKAQLSHGEWLPWLREKVEISERSAQDFMRLAKEYSKAAEIADLGAAKAAEIADLGVTKALALLALPDSERESFAAEKHMVNGVEKTVADMTGKELKQAIRERDEARKEAEEAKAEAVAAAENQAKMEADMKVLKELRQRAQEAEEKKAAELQRVEKELAELKEKPVEVAIETKDASPEQLERARAEGAAEAARKSQADLDAKEAQLKKVREELKRAQEEAKAASVNLRQAEKEAREAKAAVEKAEKMARVNSSQNMVRFTVLFNQVQDAVNQIADAMGKESPENQEKMRNALTALSDAIRKAADNA